MAGLGQGFQHLRGPDDGNVGRFGDRDDLLLQSPAIRSIATLTARSPRAIITPTLVGASPPEHSGRARKPPAGFDLEDDAEWSFPADAIEFGASPTRRCGRADERVTHQVGVRRDERSMGDVFGVRASKVQFAVRQVDALVGYRSLSPSALACVISRALRSAARSRYG